MKIHGSSDWQNLSGSITLAQRRSFCGAFGILTGEEDLDGVTAQHVPVATISADSQAADLQFLLDEVSTVTCLGFFAWANIERLTEPARE